MTADERVLEEAVRWFRGKLRRETSLYEFEQPLFSALAVRQNQAPEIYTPREQAREPTTLMASSASTTPTRPPPPDVQQELIRISRQDGAKASKKPKRRSRRP